MNRIIFWALILLTASGIAADKKVSDLNALTQGNWATGDLFPIVDISVPETKKTSVADFDLRYLNKNTTQSANQVWAGPSSGSAAAPAFRSLVALDIPNLAASKITSGQGTLSTSTSGVTVGSGSNALLSSVTVDIATATNVVPGLVSTTTQGFGGIKQFLGGLAGVIASDATAGSNVTLSTPLFMAKLTGAITTLVGVTTPTIEKVIVLTNASGGAITVKNDLTATAADRILTGTNADLTFADGASLLLYYDTLTSRWRVIGGSGSGGGSNTITSSLALTGGGTITISTSSSVQSFLVAGSAAAVTLSTTPLGSSPPGDGSILYFIGNDDTKTVTFLFNDAANGLLMDSDVTLAKGQTLGLMYSSTLARYVRIK